MSERRIMLELHAQGVQLWWPHTLGAQPLYNVTAEFVPWLRGPRIVSSTRSIGFRHVALVTVNDSDKAQRSNDNAAEGSGSHSMMFRVNGPQPIISQLMTASNSANAATF